MQEVQLRRREMEEVGAEDAAHAERYEGHDLPG